MVSISFVHANASNGRSRGPGSSPRSDRSWSYNTGDLWRQLLDKVFISSSRRVISSFCPFMSSSRPVISSFRPFHLVVSSWHLVVSSFHLVESLCHLLLMSSSSSSHLVLPSLHLAVSSCHLVRGNSNGRCSFERISFFKRYYWQQRLNKSMKVKKDILPFVAQYQPSVQNIKQASMKNWHSIHSQPLLREIFTESPIISFKAAGERLDHQYSFI